MSVKVPSSQPLDSQSSMPSNPRIMKALVYNLRITTMRAIIVVEMAAGMMPSPDEGGLTSVLTSPGGGSITHIGASVAILPEFQREEAANTSRQGSNNPVECFLQMQDQKKKESLNARYVRSRRNGGRG